jgi:hypothetical protein
MPCAGLVSRTPLVRRPNRVRGCSCARRPTRRSRRAPANPSHRPPSLVCYRRSPPFATLRSRGGCGQRPKRCSTRPDLSGTRAPHQFARTTIRWQRRRHYPRDPRVEPGEALPNARVCVDVRGLRLGTRRACRRMIRSRRAKRLRSRLGRVSAPTSTQRDAVQVSDGLRVNARRAVTTCCATSTPSRLRDAQLITARTGSGGWHRPPRHQGHPRSGPATGVPASVRAGRPPTLTRPRSQPTGDTRSRLLSPTTPHSSST